MSDPAFLVRPLRFAAILGGALLAGCASVVTPPPAPGASAPGTPPSMAAAEPIVRARSRWVPVPFADLPGWEQDRIVEAWPALRQGCARPPSTWAAFCTQVLAMPMPLPGNGGGDASLRDWLQQRLQAYRIEPLDGAPAEGLLTGYFEPQVDASRQRSSAFSVPLYGPPADLASRKPWWTRQQIDTLPAAQAALRGREVAWVASPLDALVLQIQGSGRLLLRPGQAGGEAQLVRAAYAGTNDQPYKSVGRWLIDSGELKPGEASWPAIRAWAERNPKRVNELLWSNPRVVFFREEPLPDPALGPRGAQGVPLTPGRSIAVDAQSVPYGTPVWLVSTEPLSSTPLRRLVMAQDTGSAITGAVRADYFWGWGPTAEAQAGRMKQPLRMWALWPR
jgi:membrane-bound lytic murein transglycosylase A